MVEEEGSVKSVMVVSIHAPGQWRAGTPWECPHKTAPAPSVLSPPIVRSPLLGSSSDGWESERWGRRASVTERRLGEKAGV